jgi:type IV pilus assembly protein PilP
MNNAKNLNLKYCYYIIYLGLFILLLTACSDPGMTDLEDYVNEIKKKENPNVEALPTIEQIPNYFYEVQHLRDPFEPLINSTNTQQLMLGESSQKKEECPSPEDSHRVRVGIELIPIDALQMVGTLETKDQQGRPTLWALVVAKSDGTIYRVKQGDYIGNSYGQIINITEEEIEILEQVPDNDGCWKPNMTMISLFGS